MSKIDDYGKLKIKYEQMFKELEDAIKKFPEGVFKTSLGKIDIDLCNKEGFGRLVAINSPEAFVLTCKATNIFMPQIIEKAKELALEHLEKSRKEAEDEAIEFIRQK
jgi:hypothetical protein